MISDNLSRINLRLERLCLNGFISKEKRNLDIDRFSDMSEENVKEYANLTDDKFLEDYSILI